MYHLPASALNFPKLSKIEAFNYPINCRIIKLHDLLRTAKSDLYCYTSKLADVSLLDRLDEKNLIALLELKRWAFEDFKANTDKIAILKSQLKQ